MKNWERDKQWTDALLPQVKRILGEHLIGSAPYEEDSERNTDLIVLRLDAVRIAVRIRTHEYFLRYPDEFTIRTGRPSGIKTELAKIIEGWGDYFFYGFANPDRTGLARWTLGSLNAFRIYFNRSLYESGGKQPGALKHNSDDSSDFRAFKTCDIPNFVVAESSDFTERHRAKAS